MCLLCFIGTAFHANAWTREQIKIEGSFDRLGARSVVPVEPVAAFIEGTQLFIDFNQSVPSVTITVKDSAGNDVYTGTSYTPQTVTIALDNCESGIYTLEMETDNGGYAYGSFLLSTNE
ncbi:MAG: DUF3244 domain-containing protein [Parabacteroides sp.]|nr:DUF3244 domain-containing protein [Parabacteroides sp.]